MDWPARNTALISQTGTSFYQTVAASKWKERDSLAKLEILSGNLPSFLRKFVCINTSITDSTGKTLSAYYFVAPDYLSLGTDDDWAKDTLNTHGRAGYRRQLSLFFAYPKNGKRYL